MSASKNARAEIHLYILRSDNTEALVEDASEIISYRSEKEAIREFIKIVTKYCNKHKIEENLRFNARLIDGNRLLFEVSRP